MPKTTKQNHPAAPTSLDLRQKRIAATLILADLGDAERCFLATCQQIYRRDVTSNAPFESFFCALALRAAFHRPPNPDDVAQEFESFQVRWDLMKHDSKQFLEAYPDAA